jgi:hypothetical protein
LRSELVLSLTFYPARIRQIQERIDGILGQAGEEEPAAMHSGAAQQPAATVAPAQQAAGEAGPSGGEEAPRAPSVEVLQRGRVAILSRALSRFKLMHQLAQQTLQLDIAKLYNTR